MSLSLRPHAIPDSPMARWDARWKLAAIVLCAAGFAALNRLPPSMAALAIGVLLIALSRLRFRWVRERLLAFGFASLPFLVVLPLTLDGPGWDIGPVHLSQRGLFSGLTVFSRCLAIGCLALILVGTAPLHQSFCAAHRLKVPGVLILIGVFAHRYVFLLTEELRRLRTALWVRGFRARADRHGYRTLGQTAGTVLVRGADRAERVADAMRSRGFDGHFHTLADFHTKTKDVILFMALVGAAAGLVAWDHY